MSESVSLVSEFAFSLSGSMVSESGTLVSEFVLFLLFLLSLVGE